MKKIWKLIELLNEYENKIKKYEFYEWEKWIWWDTNLFRRDTRDEEWSHLYSDTADTYAISKKYGFIWWLVENDKIDRKRKMIKQVWTWWTLDLMNFDRIQDIEYYSIEETLLMLLAISDTPIEDLISYLK